MKCDYVESMYFADGRNARITEGMQTLIRTILTRNTAVGVVSGYFDEGCTFNCMSEYALNILGYTYDEFIRVMDNHIINVIYEPDRDLFMSVVDSLRDIEDEDAISSGVRSEYRVLGSQGRPVWIQDVRSVWKDENGEKIWISSVRLVDDIKKALDKRTGDILSNVDRYSRIYEINTKNSCVYCFKGQDELEQGSIHDYDSWLEYKKKDYREAEAERFAEYVSLDRIRKDILEGTRYLEEEFKTRHDGKPGWVSNLLIYQNEYLGSETVIMAERDMTDERIFEKSVLSTVGAYMEVYYINFEDDYYCMIYPDRNNTERQGSYREIVAMHVEHNIYVTNEEGSKPISDVLSVESVTKALMNRDYMDFRYVRRKQDGTYMWCKAVVTVSERKDGVPVSVTLSIQNIDEYVKGRDRQKAQLENEARNANQANEAKTAFLSQMSHDIRTPMNSIVGMVDIARHYLDDKDKVADCLDKIALSSRHLLGLINDILDLSKIESKEVSINDNIVDLHSMFAELESILTPQLVSKEHDFKIDLSGIIHMNVHCDKLKLHQVFINIASNAVKYTPPHGAIRVTAKEKPGSERGRYTFIFEDNGVGMAPEFVSRVFKPFTRQIEEQGADSDALLREPEQGTGLGMPITKNIVELLGGTIDVESEPGRGSRFTVTFDMEYSSEARECKEIPESPGRVKTIEEYDFHGKRVLLVDDKEMNREVAGEILEMMNLRIDEARDGKEAVEKFKANPDYDIILMDIQMPIMDGFEATRIIRSLQGGDVPIVAMTANAFSQDVKASKNAGLSDHLSKPVDMYKLASVIEKWVNREK